MTESVPGFTRPVPVADIGPGSRTVVVSADAAECAAVAAVLHLPAIASLAADVALAPLGRDGVAVTGTIRARLTQTCAVSAEDFESDVATRIDVRFSPDGIDPNAEIDMEDLVAGLDAEDPPDLLVGGRIDIASVIVEFLALGLDPYPRKPGVTFDQDGGEGGGSAFADLAALKKPRA